MFGTDTVSEYVTIGTDSVLEKVLLIAGNISIDITVTQYLLCLKPIVFGIWLTDENIKAALDTAKKISIVFYIPGKKRIVARVKLSGTGATIAVKEGHLYLLKAVATNLSHINAFSTCLLYHKHYKKPGWPFDAYKALAAAYSYPRKVRLVSFKTDGYFNIFPMDLVGAVHNRYFVFGLRHSNIALTRIITTGKIVVAEIGAAHKTAIYQLGKHHSSIAVSVTALPFPVLLTDHFGFYIPEWTESYKEIQLIHTVDLGSHMLLWGEVIAERQLNTASPGLSHIHFFEWLQLKNNGFKYQLV